MSATDSLKLMLAGVALVPVGTYFVFWMTRRLLVNKGADALAEVCGEFDLHAEPVEGDVYVHFRTYDGQWSGIESILRGYVAGNQAEAFLRRLHAFNVGDGWLDALWDGTIFFPILSFWNLHGQLRSVRRQLERLSDPTEKAADF